MHCERDRQSTRVEERLDDVAHDIDLSPLVPLSLLPDHRVVEQTELTSGGRTTAHMSAQGEATSNRLNWRA